MIINYLKKKLILNSSDNIVRIFQIVIICSIINHQISTAIELLVTYLFYKLKNQDKFN